MNQEAATPVSVTVLDKEFRIACPPQERDALIRAARHLDGKMREIRHTGKVIGNDRVAVMAAINLTHELLQLRDDHNRLLAQTSSHPAPQETTLADGENVITHSVQHEAEALHQKMRSLLNDCNPS
ncbi:MAG: cell division protein ZapA [Halothiobacillaceae bacterium]|nr:cell division protein ZapA [Halothiobacillaceae bacterium]